MKDALRQLRAKNDKVAEVHANYPGVIGVLGRGSNPPRAYTIFEIGERVVFKVHGRGGVSPTQVVFDVYSPKEGPGFERADLSGAVDGLKKLLVADRYQVGHVNILEQSRKNN